MKRLRGVMPDGKAQVTVEYEDGKAKRIKTIVVSVQHSKKKPFDQFDLTKPIFKKTSAYGHFNSPNFPWEKTDVVADLQKGK